MSANININTREVRDTTNAWLPGLTDATMQSAKSVHNQLHSINPRVLDRNNLRTRLRNAHSDMNALVNDIRMLHNVIMQNIQLYEETELATLARVQNIPTNIR